MQVVDATNWGTAKSLQNVFSENQLELFLVIDDCQLQY